MKKTYSTKPKFIEVENKNRTIISLLFPIYLKREDILNKQMVNRMLISHSLKYPTMKSFNDKKTDLYIINYSICQYSFSDYILLNPIFSIPKPGIIKEFDMDKAFEFIHDSLFNPAAVNDSFDEKEFMEEKEYLLNREKNYPSSLNEYMDDEILDLYDDNFEAGLHYSEYMKQLNELTPKSSYEFYKNNIKDNKFITYIYGNLDYKEDIIKSFNKYFKQEEVNYDVDFDFFKFLPFKEYKEKREVTKYNQSSMGLIYQVKDLNESDFFKCMMLDSILGSRENNLIFTTLRTKYNLIYNSTVGSNPLFGILCIKVFFNINDEDKVNNAIDEVFECIRNKDNFENYKSRMLRAMKYDLYASLDRDFLKVEITINKETSYYYTLEEKIKYVENISYEEFMAFLDRVKLTRKLVLVAGEEND